jgi:hypothetical protein
VGRLLKKIRRAWSKKSRLDAAQMSERMDAARVREREKTEASIPGHSERATQTGIFH